MHSRDIKYYQFHLWMVGMKKKKQSWSYHCIYPLFQVKPLFSLPGAKTDFVGICIFLHPNVISLFWETVLRIVHLWSESQPIFNLLHAALSLMTRKCATLIMLLSINMYFSNCKHCTVLHFWDEEYCALYTLLRTGG